MSGRGRGRGRGGISKSFNREQLAAMGVVNVNNEPLPGPVTQPPPLYPLMDRRPVPLTPSVETDYLLILKQVLIDQMQLSPSYLKMPDDKNKQPLQAIDKLVAQLPKEKETYDWSLFPAELRPKVVAKRVKSKANKEVDVQQKLSQLEKMEQNADDTKEDNDDDNEEAQDDEEVVEEEQDEEMDDGTDYANNYFDNGEAYEDEDDNLDDGPIF